MEVEVGKNTYQFAVTLKDYLLANSIDHGEKAVYKRYLHNIIIEAGCYR
jgi:hypothetical protein